MSKRVLLIYGEAGRLPPYEAALKMAGIEPLSIAAPSSINLDGFAGLVLTGGTDVNPELYGQPRHPETEEPDEARDALEMRLLTEWAERDLPLLAICRGLQMLNVHHGGTLVQHLASTDRHRRRTPDRSLPAHSIQVESGTLLSNIDNAPRWEVNSRHHQAIDRLGSGLRISARDADDGTVEAVELPGKRFALAVQWHAEDQAASDARQLQIFRSFARSLESVDSKE
jgi:putative glutamine amidotransferase